jgi:hypothetical protein
VAGKFFVPTGPVNEQRTAGLSRRALRAGLVVVSLSVLAACNPSKKDAAGACSKNTRQTLKACSCWVDLVEDRMSKSEFEIFLLEQTDPQKAIERTTDWPVNKAFAYADRLMSATQKARRACRFNPLGL